jgi:hypothetical protein
LLYQSHGQLHELEKVGLSPELLGRFDGQSEMAGHDRQPARQMPGSGQATGDGRLIESPVALLSGGRLSRQSRVRQAGGGRTGIRGGNREPAQGSEQPRRPGKVRVALAGPLGQARGQLGNGKARLVNGPNRRLTPIDEPRRVLRKMAEGLFEDRGVIQDGGKE